VSGGGAVGAGDMALMDDTRLHTQCTETTARRR
jgi:hypothetical protein